MLRHTVATLSYRAGKVLRGAPPGFQDVRLSEEGRSAGEILAHMGDLIDWAISIVEGREAWTGAAPQPWDADVDRFFAAIARFDALLDERRGAALAENTANRLFQGPIADALTHVGQLAVMRRLSGVPIKGENYFVADIAAGRVGIDQPAPKREF
jgi:hypothetical protein